MARAAYQRARRREFIRSGMCGRCGKNPLHNNSCCLTCNQKRNEYVNSVRSKRKEAKVCIDCQTPTSRNAMRCRPCANKNAGVVTTRQRRLQTSGTCRRCGIRPLCNKSYCVECGHKSRCRTSGYALSLEDKNRMIEAQNKKCAICEREPRALHVDHDHATGRVRQLLCLDCNMTLGKYDDNPVMFDRMSAYLTRHANRSHPHSP